MFGNSAARLLMPAVRNAVQNRMQSVVSGPPTQHISFAEKVVLGGGAVASLLVVPAWVVYHIREYRGNE
ncbi:uncharacterized protein LOC129607156 [Condylostylus longicornis]|uniref:uncharacterized protein LOC129607156 n=1 Tax=Condylostylus longicornis TaxID=2530218 RepID=UPI00244DAC18|nr:uncharacterized protein LOC129607156 [Condylostylus longicornis]